MDTRSKWQQGAGRLLVKNVENFAVSRWIGEKNQANEVIYTSILIVTVFIIEI